MDKEHVTTSFQVENDKMSSLQISAFAADVAGDSAPIDFIKVARLRAALLAGDYRIDLYRIAAAIFDNGTKPDNP